jgi:8-oxo-dGTP diphosphatase
MSSGDHPVVAVGAFVFDVEDRLLLVERGNPPSAGAWTVPGGKLEADETLAQAVAREVREETGLIVEVGALACVLESFGEGFHYVIIDYLARPIGGTLASGGDARAARFVPEPELAKLPLTAGLLELLPRARALARSWKR